MTSLLFVPLITALEETIVAARPLHVALAARALDGIPTKPIHKIDETRKLRLFERVVDAEILHPPARAITDCPPVLSN